MNPRFALQRALFRHPPSSILDPRSSLRHANARSAFTLIELMVVVAIMTILLVLAVPAFTSMKTTGDTTSAIYTIKDALEVARVYAVANTTYTWVGFFEEDPTVASPSRPASEGVGRIAVSIVASTDGTRIYTFVNSATKTNATLPSPLDATSRGSNRLLQVSKLTRIARVHLMSDMATNTALLASGLPSIDQDSQVGHANFKSHPIPPGTATAVNPTTFSYPIGSASPEYTFVKIIEFNPRGEAMKIVSDIAGPVDLIGLGLQAAHGNAADTNSKNVGGLVLSGLTGATRIYRPGISQ